MRDWWQTRSPREQALLLTGGAALLALLLYLSVWEPLQNARHSTRAQVEQLQTDLRWMQSASRRIRSTPAPAANAAATTSRASQIDQSVRQSQLSDYVQRIEARERENVQIIFEAVPFDDLVLWLGQLAQGYGVNIVQLSVDATPQSGRVNARIVLQ
jgi:type II secretory pathway component PulM